MYKYPVNLYRLASLINLLVPVHYMLQRYYTETSVSILIIVYLFMGIGLGFYPLHC